jgi:hypothetical protein
MESFIIPPFIVNGRLILCKPKERPRFANGKTYMSPIYREWQAQVIGHLLSSNVKKFPEIYGLLICFHGQLNCDPGNATEALLDVFVKANLAIDDDSHHNIGNHYEIKQVLIPCKKGKEVKYKKTHSVEDKKNNYFIEIDVCSKHEYAEISYEINKVKAKIKERTAS